MGREIKILLIVLASIVALAGLVIVGAGTILYLNKDKLVEGAKDLMAEGAQFGEETDERGCLDEAMSRAEGAGNLGAIRPSLFLGACLRAAAPAEGFCEGVPAPGDIMKTVSWAAERCAAAGRPNDQACTHLMQAVQRHCDRE